jgi:hypothetical protein
VTTVKQPDKEIAMTFDRRRVGVDGPWLRKNADLFGYLQAKDGVWVPKSDLEAYENGTRLFQDAEPVVAPQEPPMPPSIQALGLKEIAVREIVEIKLPVSVSVLALLIEAITKKYPGATSRQVGYHLVIEQIDFLGDDPPAAFTPFEDQLIEALREANDSLRSARAIAQRKGDTTDWHSFTAKLDAVLRKQRHLLPLFAGKLPSVVEEAKGEPLGEGQLASETQ